VRQGQRVGMIRFGSRVDVILPASAVLRVRMGDRVRSGESVLGLLQ
jgi:phosphatidylserine decarboxylase